MKKIIGKITIMFLFIIGMINVSHCNSVMAEENDKCVLEVHEQEDISSKLQDAIKQGNKYILIPEGEYYCSGVNLNGTDGVTIEATDKTTIKQNGNTPILCVANSYVASNISVKGGTWDGNNVQTPVMRFYGNIDGISLENIVVCSSADCGIRFNGSKSVKIKNTVVENCCSYGVLCDNVDNLSVVDSKMNSAKNGLTFRRCTGVLNVGKSEFVSNTGYGFFASDCDNIIITEVTASENNAGVRVENNVGKLSLKSVYAKSNKEIGIKFYNCSGQIALSRLEPQNNGDSGISIEGCTDTTTVYKSYVYFNGNIGIDIKNSAYVKINGCLVKYNTNYGINVDNNFKLNATAWALKIIATTVQKNNDIGIRIINMPDKTKNKINIDSKTISNNNKNAGFYAENVGFIIFNGVSAKNNEGYGINVSNGKSVTIASSETSGNSDAGVILSSCQKSKLTKLVTKSNGTHGIYLNNSKVTLEETDAESNFWCGLSATGALSNLTINGGNFIGNGLRPDQYEDDDNLCAGIGIYGGAKAKIIEATCNKNHGCGITAAGSDDGSLVSSISVYGCNANENGDHGIGARPHGKINVTKSSNNVENVICDNKHTGFILNDHCSADYVRYCTINGNGKAGISISKNSAVSAINNIKVENNKEDGVHISDNSKAAIKSCEIKDNGQAGIGIYNKSSIVAIDSCNIYNNVHYGICIDAGIVTNITNNSVSNNSWAGILVRNSAKIDNISGTTSQKNKTYGLYMSNGSVAKVVSCDFNENLKDGIRITGKNTTAASIVNVNCKKNIKSGIVLVDNAKINEMTKCKLINNGVYGIAVYKGTTSKKISKLTSSENGSYQIYVEKGAITCLKKKK